jgi:beta-fructofuranosidase
VPHPAGNDHHFPRYHVRPPTGYVNDPNGPVLVDGRWHLYYQYRPATAGNSYVTWGHVSSPDLARWTHHRLALTPDPGGLDHGGCWSGNTIVADGRVTAFYSAYDHDNPYQSVVSATSEDHGHSFSAPRVVVPDPEVGERVVTFRDPYVWRQDGAYCMIVGSGGEVAAARLYTSDDLSRWTYRGPYASLAREQRPRFDTGEMWECPQLVSFGDRDALLVGTWSREDGIMQVVALTGARDGFSMAEPRLELYDQGPNFYAASAARDSPDGPLVWGWATEGRSPAWAEEADWSGMITLPRVVTLGADGHGLRSTPLPALESLRSDALAVTREATALSVADVPAQFELTATLNGSPEDAPTVLTLACSANEELRLVVDWTSGTVTVDRDAASDDPRAHGGTFAFPDPEVAAGRVSLRWFVDGSLSELFTGSGQCSTTRFYPTSAPPWRIRVTGGGDVDVSVWALADAFVPA